MTRHKVKSDNIQENSPKKRTNKNIKPYDPSNSRWDKIIGVSGKVVRCREDEKEKLNEFNGIVSKGNGRRLYCGIDGEYMFYYYEIFN